MRVVLASDRNGLDYKLRLISHLQKNGYEPVDVGTYNNVPCDTPVFAAKAARLVASGDCKYGVLLCATGTGMIMAANKIKGILCGMGYEDVEHRVDIFLTTEFIGQHHTPRVQQIRELEEGKEIKQTPIMNPNWK